MSALPNEPVERRLVPPQRDGRNIDPAIGALVGEGAHQEVSKLLVHPAGAVWSQPAARRDEAHPSYYEEPLVKEPVWRWYIPAYFYVGGLAGASAALGAALSVAVPHGTEPFVARCRVAAAVGAAASAGLLVADLGRPGRFYQMLRVFRPTSPMNVGTWLLTAFGGAASVSALPVLLPGPGAARAAHVAGLAAGALGLPLATYTAVLVANSAVPVWQATRRGLPILFAASAAASAASLAELGPEDPAAEEAVHRLALISKAAELGTSLLVEREAARVPRVARALTTGSAGTLWRSAQALSGAGLALSSVSKGRPRLRRVAGALGTAGALALRFAILRAGRLSARDPHATFEQQRQRLDARAREEALRPPPRRAPAPAGEAGSRAAPPDGRAAVEQGGAAHLQ